MCETTIQQEMMTLGKMVELRTAERSNKPNNLKVETKLHFFSQKHSQSHITFFNSLCMVTMYHQATKLDLQVPKFISVLLNLANLPSLWNRFLYFVGTTYLVFTSVEDILSNSLIYKSTHLVFICCMNILITLC